MSDVKIDRSFEVSRTLPEPHLEQKALVDNRDVLTLIEEIIQRHCKNVAEYKKEINRSLLLKSIRLLENMQDSAVAHKVNSYTSASAFAAPFMSIAGGAAGAAGGVALKGAADVAFTAGQAVGGALGTTLDNTLQSSRQKHDFDDKTYRRIADELERERQTLDRDIEKTEEDKKRFDQMLRELFSRLSAPGA